MLRDLSFSFVYTQFHDKNKKFQYWFHYSNSQLFYIARDADNSKTIQLNRIKNNFNDEAIWNYSKSWQDYCLITARTISLKSSYPTPRHLSQHDTKS